MGILARKKTHLKKKIRFQPGFAGSPRSWVNLTGQLRFVRFLLIPVFCLTWTSPIIRLSRFQADLPARSNFNNYGLCRCLGSMVVFG